MNILFVSRFPSSLCNLFIRNVCSESATNGSSLNQTRSSAPSELVTLEQRDRRCSLSSNITTDLGSVRRWSRHSLSSAHQALLHKRIQNTTHVFHRHPCSSPACWDVELRLFVWRQGASRTSVPVGAMQADRLRKMHAAECPSQASVGRRKVSVLVVLKLWSQINFSVTLISLK